MTLLNYSEQSNQPGIYVIFNKEKWRIYVGQCACYKIRWNEHLKTLRSSRHSNKFLQADWLKSGEEAFEFHVLEVMPGSTKEERNLREEHWIGVHWDKQERCYNFKKKTEASERSCYSLTPEESRQKLSASMKKHVKTEEHRKNLSISNTGKKLSAETCRKISDSQKGRKLSNERKEQQRINSTGKKHSEASRQKMSEHAKKIGRRVPSNLGRKFGPPSEEHKKVLSEAMLVFHIRNAIIKLARLFNQERLLKLEQYYETNN